MPDRLNDYKWLKQVKVNKRQAVQRDTYMSTESRIVTQC